MMDEDARLEMTACLIPRLSVSVEILNKVVLCSASFYLSSALHTSNFGSVRYGLVYTAELQSRFPPT
jgi:hypothetical protein